MKAKNIKNNHNMKDLTICYPLAPFPLIFVLPKNTLKYCLNTDIENKPMDTKRVGGQDEIGDSSKGEWIKKL